MTDEKALTQTQATNPMDNAIRFLDAGGTLEHLEKMMELQERHEKREAEKAFYIAMSQFKKNVPDILKSKHVKYKTQKGDTVEYFHADLGEVVQTLTPALCEYGLNATWEFSQDGAVQVTCVITHELGHSKRTSLTAPPDTSGGKNPIQAVSSTISYLERYTFTGALGLAAKGMDDDGRSAGDEEPPEKKEITPKTKVGWKKAKEAFVRDGNFQTVLKYADISEANQKKMIEEIELEKVESDSMRGPNDLP